MITNNFVAEVKAEAVKAEAKSVSKYDECHEVLPSKEQAERDYFAPNLVTTLKCVSFHEHKVYHVSIDGIMEKLAGEFDDIGCAEQNHSDLIAGVYEGTCYKCI